jgi:purine-binding chemotaxis protein CheW
VQLVCFYLGNQEFGVPIGDVRETIGMSPVTPVFHTPSCVVGITNLRGEILAVLDPAQLLGLSPTRPGHSTRIVIVEPNDRAAGLLVDELGSIREIADGRLAPTPSTFSSEVSAVLSGIIPNEGRPIGVLDVERLLGAPILAPFTERPDDDGPTEAHGS